MMTMRKVSFIWLLLCAFTAWSCQEEIGPGSEGSCKGSIELRLDSGNTISLQTKATDLEEGLKFDNVLVILVNNSGNVVAKEYRTEGSPVTSDIISFNGLLPGNYHVYAYANIDATAWQKTGETIRNQEYNLTNETPFSTFKNRELATLTGTNDVPSDPNTSMLLTGHKEILVGLARVSETLDLLRPVVRFKVTVHNHTQFPVTVDDLHFSDFNPDKTYLLDHRDASGIPVVPAGVTYREMPAFDTSAGDDNSVASEAEEVIYQRLIYENASPDAYKIYVTLTLGCSPSPIQLTLGDHPFGAIDLATLNKMEEGEQVDVLVINPQISPRSGRIFAYINSTSNYMAWESAGYANYTDYYNRAFAIYNEDASYDYSSRYPADTGPTDYGYSSWDGVSNTPSVATTFDYSNKRSQYFHTLTKHDGLFTLSGLAVSRTSKGQVTGSSISGIQFEAGRVVDGKNPSDVGNMLVRFINGFDGTSIQSNTNYVQDAAKQKYSNLMWQSGDRTRQDRQFLLFGKFSGGKLKRILKENNKEVPLTYMARNEEVNVILNVYYSDTDGVLQFVVDNSNWGENATTSNHIFK